MPILIQSESGAQLVSPIPFSSEQELEKALMEHPELLQDDNAAEDENATTVAFVANQLDLPEGAGKLDLLFVSSDGLPVAVEVKLGANAEARRKVVGQAIDYLSALTSLTVDELDKLVGGRLKQELHELAPPDDNEEFERLWRSVGTNLRAGKARLVVALDDAPPTLERIFRFLTDASSLDVQLFTVQQYPSGAGRIFVSRTRVDSASAQGSRGSERPDPFPELVAVFNAYNEKAPNDVRAVGTAYNFRMIHLDGWHHLHYQFTQKSKMIIELCIGRTAPATILPKVHKALSDFDGKTLANGQAVLVWEPAFRGTGRLAAKVPLETPPQTVAAAMRDLIDLTRAAVDASLMEHTFNYKTAT
jgi:hypothetical protein